MVSGGRSGDRQLNWPAPSSAACPGPGCTYCVGQLHRGPDCFLTANFLFDSPVGGMRKNEAVGPRTKVGQREKRMEVGMRGDTASQLPRVAWQPTLHSNGALSWGPSYWHIGGGAQSRWPIGEFPFCEKAQFELDFFIRPKPPHYSRSHRCSTDRERNNCMPNLPSLAINQVHLRPALAVRRFLVPGR